MNPAEPAKIVSQFEIAIEQIEDYAFRVQFDKEQYPPLSTDEPAPLGKDAAPNPSRILAAAIGNCLSASLLFCARRARTPIGPISTRVRTEIARNASGRLRIASVHVDIDPNIPEEARDAAQRCLAIFEDYCTVTASVREGIDVKVNVQGFEAS